MSKITDLTEQVTPTGNELIEVVDPDDTSMAPSGTNKKMLASALAAAATSQYSKVLIEEITDPVSGEFDFTGIPDGFDRLIIQGDIKSAVNAEFDFAHINFNGDTTQANYFAQRQHWADGTAGNGGSEGNVPSLHYIAGANAPSDDGYIEIKIPDYATVGDEKMAFSTNAYRQNSGRSARCVSDVYSSITGAVTSVLIKSDGGEDLTGTLRLYGEKSITIEDSETITTKKHVATITDPNGDFVFDLTNFQDGDRIVIEGEIRSNDGAGYGLGRIYLNGDTSTQDTDYRSTHSLVQDTTVLNNNDNFPNFNQATGSLAGATDYATAEFSIENYAASGKSKVIVFNVYGAATPTSNIRNFGSIQSSTDAAVTEVRVSASSGGWNGTLSCYIEKQGVLPAVPSGGGANTGSKFLIQEIELSTAGEFDFQNIPGGYDRLIIQGTAIGSGTAGRFAVQMNGNTTAADYRAITGRAYATSAHDAAGGTHNMIGYLEGSGAQSPTSINWVVEDYASSDENILQGESSAQYAATAVMKTHESVSGPAGVLTSIKILAEFGDLTGTLRLYGEKSITIEDSETIAVKKTVPAVLTNGEFDIDLTDYQDGDRIIIEGSLRSAAVANYDQLWCQFNGVTSGYRSQYTSGWNGSPDHSVSGSPQIAYINAASSSSATAYTPVRITIQNYTGDKDKIAFCDMTLKYDASSMWTGVWGMSSNITDAITSLKFLTDGGEDLIGTLTCYIEKQGVLPTVPKTGGLIEIESITDPVSGEFDFTNIPQTFKRLVLKGTYGTTDAATFDRAYCYINGDSTDGNYFYQEDQRDGGTSVLPTGNGTVLGYASSVNSHAIGTVEVKFEDYTDTTEFRAWGYESRVAATTSRWLLCTGSVAHKTDNTALTSIKITSAEAADMYGTLTLYGEN